MARWFTEIYHTTCKCQCTLIRYHHVYEYHNVLDMNLTRTAKEGIRRQRSFNPESNVHLLGLRQKMQQAYSWERFSQQFKLSQEK